MKESYSQWKKEETCEQFFIIQLNSRFILVKENSEGFVITNVFGKRMNLFVYKGDVV